FRVDDHGRAMAADAQTTHLGAIAGVWAGEQTLVLQRLLESFPGGVAQLGSAAARAGAEEDVALIAADAVLIHRGLEVVVQIGHGYLRNSAGGHGILSRPPPPTQARRPLTGGRDESAGRPRRTKSRWK